MLAFPVSSRAAEAPRLRAGEARAALAALGGAAQLAGIAGAPSGLRYVRAIPLVSGVPVQDALATVRVDAAGRVHASPALAAVAPRGGWAISRGRAIALALRAAGASRLRAAPLARRVSARGVAAWEVLVPSAAPLADVRVTFAGADGRLLGRVELGQHLDGQGLVFDPDPLVPGAAEPQDAGDADSAGARRRAGAPPAARARAGRAPRRSLRAGERLDARARAVGQLPLPPRRPALRAGHGLLPHGRRRPALPRPRPRHRARPSPSARTPCRRTTRSSRQPLARSCSARAGSTTARTAA